MQFTRILPPVSFLGRTHTFPMTMAKALLIVQLESGLLRSVWGRQLHNWTRLSVTMVMENIHPTSGGGGAWQEIIVKQWCKTCFFLCCFHAALFTLQPTWLIFQVISWSLDVFGEVVSYVISLCRLDMIQVGCIKASLTIKWVRVIESLMPSISFYQNFI